MASFLERYNAGEHEAVWQELSALGPAAYDAPMIGEAQAVARETMTRAKANIELLVSRLTAIGYQFGILDSVTGEQAEAWNGPHNPPSASLKKDLGRFEKSVGRLPLSVRAWFETVGIVDFRGSHPEWSCNEADYYGGDPLVLWFDREYFVDSYKEWKINVKEMGIEEVGPFVLELAPDYYHKANVSGGPPYGVTHSATADAVLVEERHHLPFVDYLRLCFRWGGFPGYGDAFDAAQNPGELLSREPFKSHLSALTRDLLPL